ncbi:AraC family transcriptional regulator [Aliiroseovarius sediminis]|uniref:helix-turn-helix domain-containing protein n=1 Tax=Aliiroseovarius sediminis TaxID=2925839 RepID=UPI001F55E807|nr:AraC family transcriptional regulator [Aliiroseovarius sediminis]MCI2394124.1 AraC family transcriptional regulator [Aliiroseovarius sediminis]
MTKDVEFPPNPPARLIAWSGQLDKGARPATRYSDRAQVLFCYDGLMRIDAGQDRWYIPDRFGIWLPKGLNAQIEVAEQIEFQSFSLHAQVAQSLGMPDRPTVLRATPLIRGIGRRLMDGDALTPAAQRRLGVVALDEIARLERPDLHLPGSREPRLSRVMSHLLERPQDAGSLAALAARVGTSERTLSRLFQKETGMSWRAWRDRMRFVLALEGLQIGRNSTELAATLGYSSPSAFVAAFRRQSGMTPTQWRHQR